MGPPKSKHGRRDVPISRELVDALRKLQGEPDALVFSASNGSPLNQGNLRRRVLAPAAEEACLWPGFGFHAFRHTCATLLFAEGRNAVQVQRWLGHHSAAFTLSTYVHLLDGDIGAPLALPEPEAAVREVALVSVP
jgi:integrase